ncbi:WD repeat-containing protein 43 [Venturia canescens]|uniref:WD repeat-containing protein 43 n=1 Tax=Venturia canescens TaxID=32260 RepID=UPI001C9BF0C3|nr:WD repeat-containing protein 43 [Venturia canescens]
MASTGYSAFSPDGQYWANCGNDGKLKIWETATNRLKQEYVPKSHLASPCSVLGWMSVNQQTTTTAHPPGKKRKKRSIVDDSTCKHIVAMGSVNGSITLWDVTTGEVCKLLENGHTATVTALTWSSFRGLFSAAEDRQIVEWNVQESGIKCKWKSGKSKVTALAVSDDGKFLLSADRTIKWWDLSSKCLIASFTGHANQVTFLRTVRFDNEDSYVISGATGEGYLSIWALNEDTKDRDAVGTLTMQDDAISVSAKILEDSQIVVLAANRSGQAHLFKYQPNCRTGKPVKPQLNIVIALDSEQKGAVQQIPIQAAELTNEGKLLLAYGTMLNLTFEKVTPDYSDKVQLLVRADLKRSKERKEETLTKVKVAETDGNVEYHAPGSATVTIKRNRGGAAGSQLPLKERLENLSLNTEMSATPTKGGNMAQLLMQGLNSKDKTILMNVLMTKDETVVKNTIGKLPVQAIPPLLKELTVMLQGKTYPSKIAVKWLQILVTSHAAHLLSHPDIGDSFGPILSLIDAKLTILSELSRLRGRVSLVTGQISQSHEKDDKDITEQSLLVYQDPDSSDDGSDVGEVALESESDENWEEISEQDGDQEELENGRSDDDDDDDDASICS